MSDKQVVPPRVALARIYKMDAYFRDLFHDRNPARRYPNKTEPGRLFGVDADTITRDIIEGGDEPGVGEQDSSLGS
jgi:hypothetical protein